MDENSYIYVFIVIMYWIGCHNWWKKNSDIFSDKKVHCYTVILLYNQFLNQNFILWLSKTLKSNLLKFRLSSHKLPSQKLQYSNIPRHQRLCTLCKYIDVADEFYYLFICNNDQISQTRNMLIPKYFRIRPNALKFKLLMNIKSKARLRKVNWLVGIVLNLFR